MAKQLQGITKNEEVRVLTSSVIENQSRGVEDLKKIIIK